MPDFPIPQKPSAAAPAIQLADAIPLAEATTPTAGTANTAARPDHRHPRLTSSTVQTLGAGNLTSVMFTRTFAVTPAVACLAIEENDSGVIIFKVKSWMKPDGTAWATGSLYGGAVIQGYRTQPIPALTALSGILLIGPLITSLTNLLSNFNIVGGNASGVAFSGIAIQPSTVTA